MKVLLTTPPAGLRLSINLSLLNVETGNYEKSIEKSVAGLMPPLAIYQLASVLREHGHSVVILDPILHDAKVPEMNDNELPTGKFINTMHSKFFEIEFSRLEKALNEVDAVGISTMTHDWFLAKLMARRIKSHDGDLPIILGGIHPTFLDKHVLNTSNVDYVVRGEGEKALPELLKALEGNKDMKEVRGVSYNKKCKIIRNEDSPPLTVSEMEENPYPAYDLMPSSIYKAIGVESSRGCRFSCIFCSLPFRTFWRGISAEAFQRRIEHTLEFTNKIAGSRKGIGIVDDNFTTNKKRAKQILLNLSETEFEGASLMFETRATELLDPEIIELCTKIPLLSVGTGAECGYDAGLRKIGKGLTTLQLRKCASLMKEKGLSKHFMCSFIIGFPWETKGDCLRTTDFAFELLSKYDANVVVYWLCLLPGSHFWNNKKAYGIEYGAEIYDLTLRSSFRRFIDSGAEFKMPTPNLEKEDDTDIFAHNLSYKSLSLLHKGKYVIQYFPYLPVESTTSSNRRSLDFTSCLPKSGRLEGDECTNV